MGGGLSGMKDEVGEKNKTLLCMTMFSGYCLRLRGEKTHGDTAAGCSLWSEIASEVTAIYIGGSAYAGAGDWGEYGDVQCDPIGAPEAVAVQGSGASAGGDAANG